MLPIWIMSNWIPSRRCERHVKFLSREKTKETQWKIQFNSNKLVKCRAYSSSHRLNDTFVIFLAFSTTNSPSSFDDRNYRRTNGVFFNCRTFVQKFRSLFHLLITLKCHRFSFLLTTDQVFGFHIAFVSL